MKTNLQSSLIKEFSFAVILIAGIVWLLSEYNVLFGPLIISGMIAYLLYPLVTLLSVRTRITRRTIVVIVYLVFLSLFIWVIVFLAPLIVDQARSLDDQIIRFSQETEILQGNIERSFGFSFPLHTYFSEFDSDLEQLLQPERAFRILRNVGTNVVWIIVIFFTSFHLLRDWERFREWFFGLFPDDLAVEYRQLHAEIKKVWQAYLRGQLLIMLFIGILSGAGAAILGIRSALLLGILAGALALIPNLGPATATAIAAIVAWVQSSSYLEYSNLIVTLLVVVVYGLVQFIEGFWLTPRIMSRRIKLHPGVIMVAVVGTLFTLGALIALIIVPIIGSLVVIVRYVYRKRAGLDPWSGLSEEAGTPEEAGESSA